MAKAWKKSATGHGARRKQKLSKISLGREVISIDHSDPGEVARASGRRNKQTATLAALKKA